HAFLRDRLRNARAYDRIAGYFRSSIFEVAAEELLTVGRVRVVCNSDLSPEDLKASQQARAQAMLQRWWAGSAGGGPSSGPSAIPLTLETMLHRNRFAQLRDLLAARDGNGQPKVEIKVIDRLSAPLVHGKAGIITLAGGGKTCFIGSVNEAREAWQDHYELLWEDESEAGIAWTQAEFDFLWDKAVPMPEAVIREIDRCTGRVEIRIEDCPSWSPAGPTDLPRAALAEAPIVRHGEGLQPWQKAFVAEFLQQRQTYGKTRLLLADEVGVGKTLSLATSALMTALLGDAPALILTPATLCQQWQVELYDRLGIPSVRWVSARKLWIDHRNHVIRTSGPRDILRCPYKVAIVSTGLIIQNSEEAACLLEKRARPGEAAYGVVVLDEAHKARASAKPGQDTREENKLLAFMQAIGEKARHVLLGTATPVQTDPLELWDLLRVLASGADHVLGDHYSPWRTRPKDALALVCGTHRPRTEDAAWDWLANPMPPAREGALFDNMRVDLAVSSGTYRTTRSYTELDPDFTRPTLQSQLAHDQDELAFFQRHNPVVRHTVLRRRVSLEKAGLMKPVGVEVYPREPEPHGRTRAYFGETGRAVATTLLLREAFEAADAYTSALMARNKGAGFLKSLLLQRICSSSRAGLGTAEVIARHYGLIGPAGPGAARRQTQAPAALLTDEEEDETTDLRNIGEPSAEERAAFGRLLTALKEAAAQPPGGDTADPKLRVVRHFLAEQGWLAKWGCIIFSQYYDTARWVAECLAAEFPGIPLGIYAGAGRSGVFRDGQFTAQNREAIKAAVREREIRLLVATDAACEGLNLQTLGTLINIDLPWNPSKLEQRLGRIKRFGQAREFVEMLNLVYEGSRDEVVYDRLSERMKDRFDIFGQLPDTLDDDWIDDQALLASELQKYAERKERATAFDIRWGGTATGELLTPEEKAWQAGWESCAKVLARDDIMRVMQEGW
ncbi:MAG: DEAD/DEAH box helicase family protein, partial [Acetobacteraceae bacterium]|nr:DEAD/DEAH box helicase family protein [Acetobacteraceae bacterium]